MPAPDRVRRRDRVPRASDSATEGQRGFAGTRRVGFGEDVHGGLAGLRA
jgi:hypothetical protein